MAIVTMTTQAPAATATDTDRKYIAVDDGGCEYVIVARDIEHAKQILREHSVEFTKEDGDSAPMDDPAFAGLEWCELGAERAARIKVHTDDGRGIVSLSDCQIGDFFCSEW